MAKWIPQGDFPTKGHDGTGYLRKIFRSDRGSGDGERVTQGYLLGTTTTIDGRSWKLTEAGVNPADPGWEDVFIVYTSPEGTRSRNGIRFRDGRAHEDGDEQWVLNGQLSGDATWYKGPVSSTNANGFYTAEGEAEKWTPPGMGADAVAWDGVLSTDSAKEGSGAARGLQVRQPSMILTWRKWMDKDVAGAKIVTVPETQATALAMLDTYKPGGTGTYETGSPRLMHVLATSGTGNKLLCTRIALIDDGDLVLREADFEYNPQGWPNGTAEPYGVGR